ncbi:hypothetical protein ABIE26_000955 [Pedobacter africanus]|uniref:Uncharacterized protein n=1 Tax=Pedobacter africanus TaxID=151894 RepID=A0ACC6KTT8_9SPHI|nr:hypothetical protein [Pedobacter africanus]MDR6782557.1 hypothetical protein [Pedobacter africanus]
MEKYDARIEAYINASALENFNKCRPSQKKEYIEAKTEPIREKRLKTAAE